MAGEDRFANIGGSAEKRSKKYGPGRIVPVRICMVRVIGFEPIRDRSREILSLLRLPISPYSHIYAQIFSYYATQRILSLLRLPISPYSHIYTWIFNCYAMQRLRLFVCRFRHTGAFLWDFCLAACGGLHGALPRRRRFFCAPLLIFFPCAADLSFVRRLSVEDRASVGGALLAKRRRRAFFGAAGEESGLRFTRSGGRSFGGATRI